MTHFNSQIVRLYDTVFDRAPDAEGLEFWNGSMHQGFGLRDLANFFIAAPEFAATYGEPTNRGFVESLYLNVLDRPGEAEGINFWTNALDAGLADRPQIVVGFSESAEHIQQMEQGPPIKGPPPGSSGPPRPGVIHGNGLILGTEAGETVIGGSWADTIYAGAGDDIVIGNGGADTMYGGPGQNMFRFPGPASDTIGDTINSFNMEGDDIIDLRGFHGGVYGRFAYGGDMTGPHSSGGFVGHGVPSVAYVTPAHYPHAERPAWVYLDVNGDTQADFTIKVNGNIEGSHDFLL